MKYRKHPYRLEPARNLSHLLPKGNFEKYSEFGSQFDLLGMQANGILGFDRKNSI